MPRLGFSEQRFHPDLALPHGLFVWVCRVIAADAFEIVLIKTPRNHAPVVARRTLRLQRTGVTGCSIRLIDHHPLGIFRGVAWHDGPRWTAIPIRISLVGEGLLADVGRPCVKIGQGHIRPDAGTLDGGDVLRGAIARIAGHLVEREVPPEATVLQQVQHRLIVHHLRRRDQHAENNAGFAAINRVVGVIPNRGPATFLVHQGRV